MSDTDPFADPNQESAKEAKVVAPAKDEAKVVSTAPDFLRDN